ncbi:MAG: hypothetical protein DIZ80_09420 [endosymbiont of Galathealinum brachiosum]|uniref:Uncharacterized protein n=1 Tax=endosymbiont of Galathealinum brachiosum TaxID=2200906 RepID=A0A370DC80_9GAMM|nr:MAG: hypothetical protein DIZ80_09420 [endosymbiont of Galathealinum brachiosum]
MTTTSNFRGLEGMLTFHDRKIGVLGNNHQFISYNSFNTSFSAQLEKFSREYELSPDDYMPGYFNSDSYGHLKEVDWNNLNLVLTNDIFKRLTNLEKNYLKKLKS